jgi:hypothetical protein
MEVTYRLTREDYQRFVQHSQMRVYKQAMRAAGWYRHPAVLFLASASVPVIFVAYLYSHRGIDEVGVGTAVVAYGWAMLSLSACARHWQRRCLRHWWPDGSSALGETRLTLTGDGIEKTKAGNTDRYGWQVFSEFSQAGDLIVLWCNPAEAILVPGRAFANDAVRQAFLDAVREHLPATPA